MTATSAMLNSGMPGINQFFNIGPKGFNRGFGTVSEAEVAP
jgi:hypothetical protein